MSGAPPFTVQSPTQTSQFVPYSPTNKSRPFFNHEQFQPTPQTPPPFPPPTLARSPRFGPPPPMAPSLPSVNGHGPHSSDSTQQYQTSITPPQYQLHRTYSGQLVAANVPPAFGSTPPSHAHPSSRPGSMVQSPPGDQDVLSRASVNGFASADLESQQPRPKSQEGRDQRCQEQLFSC